MERLIACLEAGADVAWLSARNEEDARNICQALSGKPKLGVLPRGITLSQYQEAGASCVVLPGMLQIAALCAQRAVLEELKQSGAADGYLSKQPFVEEMRSFYNEQGNDELQRIEKLYGGAPAGP